MLPKSIVPARRVAPDVLIVRSCAPLAPPLSSTTPPPVLLSVLPGVAAVGVAELWLNPGTDTPEVISALQRLNVPFLQVCSLVRLGVNPSDY
jgi:hypothetical protein